MAFKDHFSGHARSYGQSRPDYPAELFEWLAAQCAAHTLAWDCATGNGQAALALAAHFEHVIATDASEAQIAHAVAHARVAYRVAPAERSGLDDGCVDLITVAQALHWFDVDRFHAEARRVLKRGGVIAAWGYGLTRVSPEIDRIIDVFDARIVGPYWPPERRHIDTAYADLAFPYERLDAPSFKMRQDWTRRQFLDYLATWSAVQRYRKARGHDPLAWLEAELAAFWSPEEVRRVSWPLFLLAGRR